MLASTLLLSAPALCLVQACKKEPQWLDGEEGLELIAKMGTASSHELLYAGGFVWLHGYVYQDGKRYAGFVRMKPEPGATPEVVGEWDGSKLGPKMVADEASVYRLSSDTLYQYDFDGNELSTQSFAARGELLHLAQGDGKLVAITDSCDQIFIIDKGSGDFIEVDNGIEKAGGGRGIEFYEGDLFCAGNDYLFRIDPETGEVLASIQTEDRMVQSNRLSFEDLLGFADGLLLRTVEDTFYPRLAFLDPDDLSEVRSFANQEVASFSRWYGDEEKGSFLANVGFDDVKKAIVQVDFQTGDAIQVTPTQDRTEYIIGIGFGWDDDFYYWIRGGKGGNDYQIVRYPVGKMEVPFEGSE